MLVCKYEYPYIDLSESPVYTSVTSLLPHLTPIYYFWIVIYPCCSPYSLLVMGSRDRGSPALRNPAEVAEWQHGILVGLDNLGICHPSESNLWPCLGTQGIAIWGAYSA